MRANESLTRIYPAPVRWPGTGMGCDRGFAFRPST
jgi:hypothetical protein